MKKEPCPICQTDAEISIDNSIYLNYGFIVCPYCGRFEMPILPRQKDDLDYNKVAAFLYYNNQVYKAQRKRETFYFIGDLASYEKTKSEYPDCRFLDKGIADNWYPHNFSEKIDKILLGLAELAPIMGSVINLERNEIHRFFFASYYDMEMQLI